MANGTSAIAERSPKRAPEDDERRNAARLADLGEQAARGLRWRGAAVHRAWLDVERRNLLEAHQSMVSREPRLAARLALVLDASGNALPEARRAWLDGALASALDAGDPALESNVRLARADALASVGALDAVRAELCNVEAAARARADVRTVADAAVRRVVHDLRLGPAVDPETSERAVESAIETARALDDVELEGIATSALGALLAARGRRADARRTLDRAATLHRRAEDGTSLGTTLLRLGNLTIGRAADGGARARLEAAVALFEDLGDRSRTFTTRFMLGLLHHHEGDLRAARDMVERVRSAARSTDDVVQEARATTYLAAIDLEGGNPDALESIEAALSMHRDSGDVRYTSYTLWCRAMARLSSGDLRRARDDVDAALDICGPEIDGELATVALATRGALLAYEDPPASAEAFACARRHPCHAEPWIASFVSTMEIVLRACVARTMIAGGEPARANRERARVQRLLARTTARGGPASWSSDVRLAAKLVSRELDDLRARSEGLVLEVAEHGRWFRVGGKTCVDLEGRTALQQILVALVAERETVIESLGGDECRRANLHADESLGAARALGWQDLQAAGWPGEKMLWAAGRNRVYSAMKILRQLGLATVIVTRDHGYAIDPNVVVRRIRAERAIPEGAHFQTQSDAPPLSA